MTNDNAKNCWEYWDCPEEIRNTCDAYILDWGKKCHLVSPSVCPRRKTDYKYCWQCPWCKKVAPKFCEEKDSK